MQAAAWGAAGDSQCVKDSYESETSSPADRQAEIDTIQWYHDFDFADGLHARSQSPEAEGHRYSWRFIERQLEAIDFREKTVLEIGAWDGYWSFYAERRGAKSVLASDDRTQNWASGGGILLARRLLKSQIEVRQDLSIYELFSLHRKFDIILCLGVYYHLLDPFYGLAQIRHCCHQNSIVLLEGDLAYEGMAPNEVRFNYGGTQEFFPSAPAFERLLKAAYFTVTSQTWMLPRSSRSWFRRRDRRVRFDRAFTVCCPFEGVNECHVYEPPFGLTSFDERFRAQE